MSVAITDTSPASPFFGRAYVTWDVVHATVNFAKSSEAGIVMESHSDDGGLTWSRPQAISGSSDQFCTYRGFGGAAGACDQSTDA